jgi:hypothetical protein
MITNTVETKSPSWRILPPQPIFAGLKTVAQQVPFVAALALFVSSAYALPLPGPWTPIFKGVDLASGTNNPNLLGSFPRWQVVRCVRVDLSDPDVQLFSTPPAASYIPEYSETLTQTVPNFLRQNALQVACDANFYSANPGGSDPTSEGLPCEVFGLQISAGVIVSDQTAADAAPDPRYASILFSVSNQAAMVFINLPPGTNTDGIYTAITGYYPIVSNGANIGSYASVSYPDQAIHQAQPRTAIGLSQDNHYLFLMTIDGRQSPYSEGAIDAETAYWLLQFGAWNGINMDGGGSTSMYMADSAGNPIRLNHSSYLAAYGHERYIGSHFGIYAKPLPGFINDVTAQTNDTTATIGWTTTGPGTTLVQYGLTSNLGSASTYSGEMVTNHSALLTGLLPGVGYYYRAFSSDGQKQYSSQTFFFVTQAATNQVFDFTNSWTYGTANLDGVNWTAPVYDDSGWSGSGSGLLWADNRGANPNIPMLNTQMGVNPSTGFPFSTYYFRTHFSYTNTSSASSLLFSDYIDDGAVFYLNGTEIYRLRMPAAPTPISNTNLSSGYACSGDATCPDYFVISGSLLTNLVVGDNVLAAEVHNYDPKSPDITFGASLAFTSAFPKGPQLSIQKSNLAVTVSWAADGFTLQQADSPIGPWASVPGPITNSPFVMPNSVNAAQYFRLIK